MLVRSTVIVFPPTPSGQYPSDIAVLGGLHSFACVSFCRFLCYLFSSFPPLPESPLGFFCDLFFTSRSTSAEDSSSLPCLRRSTMVIVGPAVLFPSLSSMAVLLALAQRTCEPVDILSCLSVVDKRKGGLAPKVPVPFVFSGIPPDGLTQHAPPLSPLRSARGGRWGKSIG
jgi:hypothetical protein